MRILHTSDWHLGQHFMGKSREPEHQAFIDWLLDTVTRHNVDALIIAGDVFDTGTPPSYARTLYNRFIVELQKTPCQQLIIIGGNHDSVATLNESRELLACLNTHVVGGVASQPDEQIRVLNDNNGQPGAVVCAIPFIRPRDVLESQTGDTAEAKQQALQQAIADHYRNIHQRAKEKADFPLPIIATGHLTTVGGQLTESVRELYIGTLSAFPVSAFPAVDYIALGHLHRPQTVARQEHIRYSGSPIPLSFDEAGASNKAEKQVVLADFANGKLLKVTPLPVPVFRPLISLKGSLEEIGLQLGQLPESPTLQPWLEVEIATDDYLHDLQNQVERLLEERELSTQVELLRVRRQRKQISSTFSSQHVGENDTLAELTVSDVFQQRLAEETLTEEQLRQLMDAFQEVLIDLEENPEKGSQP